VRYQAVHAREVEDILALDIALRRNERDWLERLPPHVDDKLARRVMHLLAQLSKLGSMVVLSTHDDDLMERHRHPILRMSRGRLTRPAAMAAPGAP